MKTLTQNEVHFYKENGYLLPDKPLFSVDKFSRLKDIFEEHLELKGSKSSDELDTPHFQDERLLEFLLNEEVLDVVEPIIGPDIVLWSSHFISKQPFTGRATPWHEDSAYWNGRFDQYENIVTIWLALDKSAKENGCMRVIPGSHRNGFSEYEKVDASTNTFGSQIKNLDDSQAIYFERNEGQCSLHDSRIIHGAEANTSAHRRCGYTMRYIPASVKVNPEKNPNWKLWLARGKDTAGNTYVNA